MNQSIATTPISDRLQSLRAVMTAKGWQAVLIPSSDPHLSEYLPLHWQGREWFSGFTGSSGTLIVADQTAALFTDSRYWEQAETELTGTGIDLIKLDGPANPAYADWLAQLASKGQLAVDGMVLGLAQSVALTEALSAKNWSIVTDQDPLSSAWSNRADLPNAPVQSHDAPYVATTRAEKLKALREAMASKGATEHWLSTLDDIAWLFNLRGADVEYNPVFLAHALITTTEAQLFVGVGKVSKELEQSLALDGIHLRPYPEALDVLRQLPSHASLLIDPKRITVGTRQAVPKGIRVVESINPTTLAKSRKADSEADHVRRAMEQDGAAMAEFYAWFERALGHEHISELTVDERMTEERARRPGYVSLSFPTIAGFNANGALPHYRATANAYAVISTPQGLTASGLLLIDSGAQYLGGTTDITRVWAIGDPSVEQKRDFTLVLKGMMNLSRTQFPKGTLAPMLDALARAPLWAHGMDFGHGTGHGVGYFLNVHEGPQSISKAIPDANMAMQAGMITSNEPGLYRPGKWGIRIENLLLNVPVERAEPNAKPGEPEYGDYLAFETLSLCPIDTRCIDRSLLREDEINWLNQYHAEVLRRVGPLVTATALEWLTLRTAAI